MRKIIKRNGKVEDFKPEKIQISIENAALELGFKLTNSDLNIISKSVEEHINILHKGEDEKTNVYEVRSLIQFSLNNMGFPQIATKYGEFINEFK